MDRHYPAIALWAMLELPTLSGISVIGSVSACIGVALRICSSPHA
jgi:hypothetical protein